MKPDLIKEIVCPDCYNTFELKEFSKIKQDIEEGLLICKACQSSYPIIKGIPRIIKEDLISGLVSNYKNFRIKYQSEFSKTKATLAPANLESLKVARGFRFEWLKHSRILPEHKAELMHVFGDLMNPADFTGKVVLDAGCGQGRFSYFITAYGPKEVYCVDFSESVLIAKENLEEVSNVHVIQADIFNLPFKNIFDMIYSIGVIHHLPQPQRGFNCLLERLRPKGQIFLWIYGYSSIVPILKFLKLVTLKIDIRTMWFLSLLPAIFLYILNKIYLLCSKIIFTKKIAEYIPFHMYSDRSFHNIWTICFDHLTTSIAHYFKEGELKGWLRNKMVANSRISERYAGKSGNSWRLWAEKRA